jgi:hypothetical protein
LLDGDTIDHGCNGNRHFDLKTRDKKHSQMHRPYGTLVGYQSADALTPAYMQYVGPPPALLHCPPSCDTPQNWQFTALQQCCKPRNSK